MAVPLIQYVLGITTHVQHSLQDLNKRFYATGMYGKLLNACGGYSLQSNGEHRCIKESSSGEDTLIYEKKGQDAIHFHSYAKLLFFYQ